MLRYVTSKPKNQHLMLNRTEYISVVFVCAMFTVSHWQQPQLDSDSISSSDSCSNNSHPRPPILVTWARTLLHATVLFYLIHVHVYGRIWSSLHSFTHSIPFYPIPIPSDCRHLILYIFIAGAYTILCSLH